MWDLFGLIFGLRPASVTSSAGSRSPSAQTADHRVAKVRDRMNDLFKLILGVLTLLFKSRAKLAEILILRQRPMCFAGGHRNDGTSTIPIVFCLAWFPSALGAIAIVRPETIIRWHRTGFRAYWRWRSRIHVGRPKVSAELRTLIGEMSRANILWGTPRTHGELLKLGAVVSRPVLGGLHHQY